jgi:hypothetical protein
VLAQNKIAPAPAIASASSTGCPVSFSAQRKTYWSMSTGSTPKAAVAQAVQLTFSDSDASRISKAAVTVHGTSSKLQTTFTASHLPKDSWTESFTIERSEITSALSPRALRTKALSISIWVEITQIDFADGTMWKGNQEEQCVLVAGD